MNFNQVKNYLQERDWYVQAVAAKWLYVSCPWEAIYIMKIFGKKIPVKYDVHAYMKDDFMSAYISKASMETISKYYLNLQQKDPRFIDKLSKNWQEKNIKYFLNCDQIIREINFSNFDDKKFVQLYKNFLKIYLGLWQEVIFLDSYDYCGQAIIDELITKEKKNLNRDELAILLTPPKVSFLQQERIALLELTEKYLKTPKFKKILISKKYQEAIKEIPLLEDELLVISKKFHWLNNDYATFEYLRPDYFYAKIFDLITDSKKIKAEREMRASLKTIKTKKQAIIKKHHLSKNFINITNYLAILGNLRDERKTYNQLANGTLYVLAEEFSRRSKKDMKEVEQLLYWELENLLSDKKVIINARKRLTGCFQFIADARTHYEFYDNRAFELKNVINHSLKGSMKGMPAFNGKVKGTVKIIKDKSEFYKMQKEDILVAPNTRPEYVPIMKLASAIITEEGGITCHAAIVSRELKIPCVVGVQGITSALNDGELVEVDAMNGLINKL